MEMITDEAKETRYFIETLKKLSDLERAEVKGYINCLRTIKIISPKEGEEK